MIQKVKAKGPPKYDWAEVKVNYLGDPTTSFAKMGRKYGIPLITVRARAEKEQWATLRVVLEEKVQELIVSRAENDLEEVKTRHLKIGKILQKTGLDALIKGDYQITRAKEALDFIVSGMEIERKIFGLDGKEKTGLTPTIVNIIGKEKQIVGKYVEAEEIDAKK